MKPIIMMWFLFIRSVMIFVLIDLCEPCNVEEIITQIDPLSSLTVNNKTLFFIK